MTWAAFDPSFVEVLTAFLAQVAKTVVLVRVGADGAILQANPAFSELIPEGEDPVGRALEAFIATADGGPLEPEPRAFDSEPAVFHLLASRVSGTRIQGFLIPQGDGACLIGERLLPATLEALDVMTSTTNELASLNRELQRKFREKALAHQEGASRLSRVEAQHRLLFEHMTQGVVYQDDQGRITDANPAAEAILGVPLARLRAPEAREPWSQAVREDGTPFPVEEQPGWVALRTGQVQRGVVLGLPRAASGGLRWVLADAVPAAPADPGGRAQVITTFSDITERAAADRVLKESEARFQAIFLGSPIAIVITSRDKGCILDANPAFCALFGYPPGEPPRGTPAGVEFWVSPVDRDSALAHLEREGSLRDFETSFRTQAGEEVPMMLSAERVSLGDEDATVALFQDLRPRHRAEAERRGLAREVDHLQRMESIGRLAGGVSHDMNNVLAAIMSLASVLKLRHRGDPVLRKDAETILEAAGRGRDLVRGLMDFARKDLQDAAPLDLNDLVRQEADLLERTTLRRIEIRKDLAEPLGLVLGERSALASALMNLCVNACDAMPRGGHLTLATRNLPSGWIEVSVEDDGEGMPPEVAARALEPFYTTKAVGKGTGLGLSIVYGTVKVHGGAVDISSHPGRGTRVSIVLPPFAGSEGPAAVAAAADAAPGPALRLLLVDDDELIRATVPTLLESLGHEVHASSSGLDALRRLESGLAVDLVILDLNMPGLDGMETLSRIRILRPDLPVLVATGFQDPATIERFARFPRLRVMHKPFLADDLEAALRALSVR